MINLSAIQNEELRDLIESSKKFALLPEEQQNIYLKKILTADAEKEAQLLSYFKKHNAVQDEQFAELEQKKVTLLTKFYDDIIQLEKKFKKLMKSDAEKATRSEEEKEITGLLEELDES